jgi:hypothetical protein
MVNRQYIESRKKRSNGGDEQPLSPARPVPIPARTSAAPAAAKADINVCYLAVKAVVGRESVVSPGSFRTRSAFIVRSYGLALDHEHYPARVMSIPVALQRVRPRTTKRQALPRNPLRQSVCRTYMKAAVPERGLRRSLLPLTAPTSPVMPQGACETC